MITCKKQKHLTLKGKLFSKDMTKDLGIFYNFYKDIDMNGSEVVRKWKEIMEESENSENIDEHWKVKKKLIVCFFLSLLKVNNIYGIIMEWSFISMIHI